MLDKLTLPQVGPGVAWYTERARPGVHRLVKFRYEEGVDLGEQD